MRIAVLTTGRHDLAILAPVMRALDAPPLVPLFLATGQHTRGVFPSELAGAPVAACVPAHPDRDDGVGAAHAAGATLGGVADALARLRADALLVIGDRSETLAAAVAATCLRLPIIHLHGGEITLGAIDDACRDAISQLASVHAVAHAQARDRLVSLGVPADRIRVTGAPGLDTLFTAATGPDLVTQAIGRTPGHPFVILTHHPTTLGALDPGQEAAAVISGVADALASHPRATLVATLPNQDAGGRAIGAALQEWAQRDARVRVIPGFGPAYPAALAWADAMVGNSSSGIIEAPAFDLPVVNIGARQAGRLRCGQVVDAPCRSDAICSALRSILDTSVRPAAPRPARATAYGDGNAAGRIRHAVCELLPGIMP